MKIQVLEGRYSTRIDKIQRYVLFRYSKKRRLCVHLMLAVPRAYFCASNMEGGLEISPKMSKYCSISFLNQIFLPHLYGLFHFPRYVRQRMGRNKLKSFGPVICRMAMLVHVRCGSFFFKALGITLLFMAGFPNDLVQRETNYKNLDLLQKYYRYSELQYLCFLIP